MDRGVYYTKHDREFVLRNKDTKIKTQATTKFHSSSNKIRHIFVSRRKYIESNAARGEREIEGEYNKTKQGTIYIYIYYRTLTKYILLPNDGKIYTYIYIIKQRKI